MNTIIEDNYRHKGLRKQMVDQLRTKGITDEAVLSAINEVPRHIFLDSSFVELAYQDMAFPIGTGQTISQPSTVSFPHRWMAYPRAVLASGVSLYSHSL